MGRLRSFFGLPAGRRRELVEAGLRLLAARFRLSCFSFERVLHRQEALRRSPRATRAPEPGEAERIAWAVDRASRLVPRATCLAQALAAQGMLARRGIRSEIRIGVAHPSGRRLEAHAWLECAGRVVLGMHEPDRFRPLKGLQDRGP
jgi:hypothetical protein